MRKTLLVVLAVLFLALAAAAQAANHTVTISGTYDFSVDNACSATVTTNCIKQFNVYDTTTGASVLLGSVPAPSGATASNAAVTGSFSATVHSGNRTFIITAATSEGIESDPKLSPVISQVVKPGATVNLTLGVS